MKAKNNVEKGYIIEFCYKCKIIVDSYKIFEFKQDNLQVIANPMYVEEVNFNITNNSTYNSTIEAKSNN